MTYVADDIVRRLKRISITKEDLMLIVRTALGRLKDEKACEETNRLYNEHRDRLDKLEEK